MSKISNWRSFLYRQRKLANIHIPWNMQMGKAAEQQQKSRFINWIFSGFIFSVKLRASKVWELSSQTLGISHSTTLNVMPKTGIDWITRRFLAACVFILYNKGIKTSHPRRNTHTHTHMGRDEKCWMDVVVFGVSQWQGGDTYNTRRINASPLLFSFQSKSFPISISLCHPAAFARSHGRVSHCKEVEDVLTRVVRFIVKRITFDWEVNGTALQGNIFACARVSVSRSSGNGGVGEEEEEKRERQLAI